jgi:hypothetical protein
MNIVLRASCKRIKGLLYIPKEIYYRGYVNAGGILGDDYLMLGATEPGFYCSWHNYFYMTKSRKIFRVYLSLLSRIWINSEGFYVDGGMGKMLTFTPHGAEYFYEDMFYCSKE